MPSERLQIILELVTGGYKREAREAASATDGITRSAGGVTSSLGRMIGPAAIGGAVVGLVHMAEKAGENADRLFDLAAQTGLSTDALQEWEFVAKTAGASQEVFSDAVKAVIKNLSEAANGTGAASKAYETLGVNVLDASGKLRSAGDITDEVFMKLAGMSNITERNALAQDIFGKKWEETISVLDLGTDALASARGEAHKLGAVVSGSSLQGADKFREAWAKVKTVLEGKLMEVLGELGPTLADIAEGAVDVATELKPLLDGLGAVTGAIDDMKTAGEEWSGSTNPLIAGFGEYISNIGVMTVLTGNYTTAAGEAADVTEQRLNPAFKEAGEKSGDAADGAEFMADAVKDDLIPAVRESLTPLERLAIRQQAAADATQNHLNNLISLSSRLLASINPAINAFQALEDLEQAHKDAETAAREHGKESEEAAIAQLELAEKTVIAQDALSTFQLNADSSARAVATALGIPLEAAEKLLDTLNLLDGSVINLRLDWEIEALDAGVIPEGLGITIPSGGGTVTTSGGTVNATRFASGGSMNASQVGIVGEKGPELWIPDRSGSIIPNGAWGSRSVSITLNSPTGITQQDLQYATLLASIQTLVEG